MSCCHPLGAILKPLSRQITNVTEDKGSPPPSTLMWGAGDARADWAGAGAENITEPGPERERGATGHTPPGTRALSPWPLCHYYHIQTLGTVTTRQRVALETPDQLTRQGIYILQGGPCSGIGQKGKFVAKFMLRRSADICWHISRPIM